MAAHRYLTGKRPSKDLLSEVLDFGQENAPTEPTEISERIRKVKEKIEEINERIARLTTRTG